MPLRVPYALSFGPVDCLDPVLCRIETSSGRVGWGESTPLPGYSNASADEVWKSSSEMCHKLVGKGLEAALDISESSVDGFLNTAVCTAVEDVAGVFSQGAVNAPLAALLQEDDEGNGFRGLIEKYRKLGFQTFKLKAGYLTLEDDIQRVQQVQSLLMSGEWLRIDANQAWGMEEAVQFSQVLQPELVQLLEQPLPKDDWNGLAELGRKSPVPLMLDEAIQDVASVRRAAEIPGVQYVKLKWMKQGGWRRLLKHLEVAEDAGLQVVIGNGVATGLNNYHEALFWQRYLSEMNLAGEMTGFMKTCGDITAGQVLCRDGRLTAFPSDGISLRIDTKGQSEFIQECRRQSFLVDK